MITIPGKRRKRTRMRHETQMAQRVAFAFIHDAACTGIRGDGPVEAGDGASNGIGHGKRLDAHHQQHAVVGQPIVAWRYRRQCVGIRRGRRRNPAIQTDFRHLHIHRDPDMRGTTRLQLSLHLREHGGQPVGDSAVERTSDRGVEYPGIVRTLRAGILEFAAALRGKRNVAGDKQHRRTIRLRGHRRPDQVRAARSADRKGRADAARGTRIAIGHVTRREFMVGKDRRQRGVVGQGLDQWIDLHAGNHEDMAHAASMQVVEQGIGHARFVQAGAIVHGWRVVAPIAAGSASRARRYPVGKSATSQLLPSPPRSTTRKSAVSSSAISGWCHVPRW